MKIVTIYKFNFMNLFTSLMKNSNFHLISLMVKQNTSNICILVRFWNEIVEFNKNYF